MQDTTTVAATLEQALQDLQDQGAARFDPVGYFYLERLAGKRLDQGESVRQALDTRLQSALAQFRARFDRARAEALAILAEIKQRQPDAAAQAETFFGESNFHALRQLATTKTKTSTPSPLTALLHAMQASHDAESEEASQSEQTPNLSLEEQLRKQEQDALQALTAAQTSQTPQAGKPELKSLRRFRETWAKQEAERRVVRAIAKPPEHAGPLNSHKLVISALATMRDISPEYTNRLLSLVDSLLWLNQVSATPESAGDKANTNKSKRKGRRSG